MTREKRALLAACLFLAVGMSPVAAQEADWPCVQRLVPELAAGQMWSGPPLDGPTAGPVPPDLDRLARELIDPALPPERLRERIAAFAAGLPAEARADGLARLFSTALDRINAERADLIAGIKAYAHRQRGLAERIAAENHALDRLHADPSAPAARIDELQAARNWDQRIYADRQRSLRLVCEQPVLLEQRAFALARLIQDHLSQDRVP
jgi:hypothetical protein